MLHDQRFEDKVLSLTHDCSVSISVAKSESRTGRLAVAQVPGLGAHLKSYPGRVTCIALVMKSLGIWISHPSQTPTPAAFQRSLLEYPFLLLKL